MRKSVDHALSESLERLFLWQIAAAGLPVPEREVRVCPERRFRWDFAYPGLRLAVEIEGGIWAHHRARRCPTCGHTPAGAHGRATGIERDLVKQNLGTRYGWRLLRYSSRMVRSGAAVRDLAEVLAILGREAAG